MIELVFGDVSVLHERGEADCSKLFTPASLTERMPPICERVRDGREVLHTSLGVVFMD